MRNREERYEFKAGKVETERDSRCVEGRWNEDGGGGGGGAATFGGSEREREMGGEGGISFGFAKQRTRKTKEERVSGWFIESLRRRWIAEGARQQAGGWGAGGGRGGGWVRKRRWRRKGAGGKGERAFI